MHSISELIRQTFDADNRMITIIRTADRRFQVSVQRPDRKSFGVFINDDVIDTLREAMTESPTERRYRLGIWTNAPEDLFGPFTDKR